MLEGELEYIETSFFGEEYKSTGTITGCNKKRSWFANVIMQDDKNNKSKITTGGSMFILEIIPMLLIYILFMYIIFVSEH